MANKSNLNARLARAAGTSKEQSAAKPASANTSTTRVNSRDGLKQIATWVTPEAHKQLAMLAVETEISREQLLRDGLDLIFAQHGKQKIASPESS